MAWIESHQTLRDHPKLMRLARLLDVPRTSAAGLLHFLWWWALDHAEDGDLTDFDALDLALAAGWEGDPDTFVKALEECGPGQRAGFLACTDGRLVLHDWHDYAGKLVDRRVKDRERKKAQRKKSDVGPKDVQRTSVGTPTVQNRTVPNPTEEPPLRPDGRTEPDDAEETFEQFWTIYPERDGRKRGKGNALVEWRKLTIEQRRRAYVGARNVAGSGDDKPKDAERFLRRTKGGDFPFDDYQTSVTVNGRRKGGPAPPAGRDADFAEGWSGRVLSGGAA
jgi:hypothetical protein